jgi:hypothetical protein
MPTLQPQSGLEFVSELSDLTIGAAMLIFTLAPFSLPVLVLTALAAVALVIPVFLGLVVAASFLVVRRWWRSRDRLSGDIKPSRCGDGKARTRRRRAPERSAARLSPSQWVAIASTPKRLESQQG